MQQHLATSIMFCRLIIRILEITVFSGVVVCSSSNGNDITSQEKPKPSRTHDELESMAFIVTKRARCSKITPMFSTNVPDFEVFIKDPKLEEFLDEFFNHDVLSAVQACKIDTNSVCEVIAMHLYNLRKRMNANKNVEQLSVDDLIQEHNKNCSAPAREFPEIDISWFDIRQFSTQIVKVLEFFHDHCGTTALNLSGTMIDVSTLNESNFGRVKSLSLGSNEITDISSLSNFTGLVTLDISNNRVHNFIFLHKLELLENLDLSSNALAQIHFIPIRANIRWLSLRNNHIEVINPLIYYPKLEYLDLGQNKIGQQSFDSYLELVQLLPRSSVSILLLDGNTNLTVNVSTINKTFPALNSLCLDKKTIDSLSDKVRDRFERLKIDLKSPSSSTGPETDHLVNTN